MKIQESHFVITGGNRGIGWGVAEMAAREGARVYIASRTWQKSQADQLLKLGAKSVEHIPSDLATREGAEALAKKLESIPVDILFNNAGLLTGGLIEEQSLDEIYSMFQVNLQSLIHITRAVIPSMLKRKRGKIINNSSVSAFMHFPCASTYAASKAAVVAFTDCIEEELKGTGVTTLCLVTPGIKTRMFDEIEKKYAKNFEIPTDSISPEIYASQIKNAIERDDNYLFPKGSTAIGLWLARHANPIFRSAIGKRFKR